MLAPTAMMRSSAALSLWWRDFLVAAGMLTRLPLGRGLTPTGVSPDAVDLARAGRAMPLVGVMVGLAGAAAFWISDGLGLPPALSGLLALAATILLTGAFHEDGLADVADGFGGGVEPVRKLAIMRASDTGVFGVLALVLSVALRAGALAALAAPVAVALGLVAAHALARAVLPVVMATTPLARTDGLAARVGRPRSGHAAAALGLGGLAAVLALGLGAGLLAFVVAGAAAATVVAIARAQIGGYSGDVLGAVEQVAETAVLLLLVTIA